MRGVVWMLLIAGLARAGDSTWEVTNGGNCGVNMTCAVGNLTASTSTVSGNQSVGGTLGVSGATSLAALTCSTLGVSSAATMQDITARSIDGGTLNITGGTRLAALTAGAAQFSSVAATGTISNNGTNLIAAGGCSYGGFSNTSALAICGANSGNPTVSCLDGAGNCGVDLKIQDGGTVGLGANVVVTAAGGLLGSGVTLGWLQVKVANTACVTTCAAADAGACVKGQDLALLTYEDVDCTNAAADTCTCTGHL